MAEPRTFTPPADNQTSNSDKDQTPESNITSDSSTTFKPVLAEPRTLMTPVENTTDNPIED
jgi:hypothetical protein